MRIARAAAAPFCAGLRNKLLEALCFATFVQGAESSGAACDEAEGEGEVLLLPFQPGVLRNRGISAVTTEEVRASQGCEP